MRKAEQAKKREEVKKDAEKQNQMNKRVEDYFAQDKLRKTQEREKLRDMTMKQVEDFREDVKRKNEAEKKEAMKYNQQAAETEEKNQ